MSFPNVSAWAVRERALTLFFLLLSILAGLQAFITLGRAEDPAFTVRAMVVSVMWPGATPEELQTQVVDRLEKRIQEVDYIYRIDTTIRQGQASLQIEFQDYSPKGQVNDLFYEVRKRMQEEAGSLPKGVIGPIVNDDFADVYFSLMSLSAPGLPLHQLTREAEQIRDRLTRVPGVRKVMLLGEQPERVFLEFDATRLNNLGVSPQAIFQAIEDANQLMPAGRLETTGPSIFFRVDSNLAELEKLASTPIRVNDHVISLGDIATIRQGQEEPARYVVRAFGNDALLLGVVMEKGINGLDLGAALSHFVEQEQRELPLGMELHVLTNQAQAIESAVGLFQTKFLIAVMVVVAVSMVAIGWRAGLIVGIAVPLTLGITFVIMQLMGMNLDRVTLGALIIALGLLVDDAIIAVEMMLVKIEAGWDKAKAAAHAWTVTAAPMLYGTLVTVAGFVPIGFARSSVGEYAGNIFWVLGISLIVSWLVAVIFVPYLGVKMLSVTPHTTSDKSLSSSSNPKDEHSTHAHYQTPNYQRLRSVVQWCVRHRLWVVGTTVGLLMLSIIGMATVVQKQFFPSSDRPEVLISVYMPRGSSFAATDATVSAIETFLEAVPDIRSLSAYIGAGAPRFFISANPEMPDPSFAKIIVVAHNAKARDRIIEHMERAISNGQFPQARVRATALLYGPPVTWPIAFRLQGPDPLVLRETGRKIQTIMSHNPHVVDPHLEWDERVPTLHIDMDQERLRLLGLTPHDVSRQLQFQQEGLVVSQLRQGIRTVDLVARLDQHKTGIALEDTEIQTQDQQTVPLNHLGQVQIRYEDPVIRRYNRERVLMLQGDVQGAQPNDVSFQLWDQLASLRDNLPPGYRLTLAGSVEESGKGEASIQKLQPLMIGLMLIFIMLQMRSFSGTFMVVATAPLGLIGAVLALLLFNQPFGFVALLGLTGLGGILMRNTLILTQQVSDNFKEGLPPFNAVVEAAVQRARPVILTALAAVLAFIPLTFDTFWGPLAYVLIGGVAVGTVISLLFVPALYGMWFRIKENTA